MTTSKEITMKTAEELGLTDKKYDALKWVLERLETDTLPGEFNMGEMYDQSSCGTVACIAGWAAVHMEPHGNRDARYQSAQDLVGDFDSIPALWTLCYCTPGVPLEGRTCGEAAQALRNYLETGDSKWDEVVKPISKTVRLSLDQHKAIAAAFNDTTEYEYEGKKWDVMGFAINREEGRKDPWIEATLERYR